MTRLLDFIPSSVCCIDGESMNAKGLNGTACNWFKQYFETIEKQYKYYTNLSCHGLCLPAVWPGRWGAAVEGGGVECNRTPHKGISQSLQLNV